MFSGFSNDAAFDFKVYTSISADVDFGEDFPNHGESWIIVVGTAGDLVVTKCDGNTETIPSEIWTVSPAQMIRCRGIVNSGTGASNILVLVR